VSTAASRTSSSVDGFLRPLARSWPAWALFAAACLVLGIVALADTALDLVMVSTLFGAYLIVAGLFDAVAGLTAANDDPARRIFAIVLVVVAMIAGLICLRHPGSDLFVLVLAGGIYLVVAGALHLASAFDEAQPGVERVLGGVDVVIGILILSLPALSLGTFAPLFSVAILARGAAALVEAWRLRSAQASRKPVRRTSRSPS
jgi:uncharacterized membrane protein HdeD (DUF308 family)